MAKSIKKKDTRKSLLAAANRAEQAQDKLYSQQDALQQKLYKMEVLLEAAEERCCEAYGALDAFDHKSDPHQSPFGSGILCIRCNGTGLA